MRPSVLITLVEQMLFPRVVCICNGLETQWTIHGFRWTRYTLRGLLPFIIRINSHMEIKQEIRGQRRDAILAMDVGHTSSNIHGSINKRTERLEVKV